MRIIFYLGQTQYKQEDVLNCFKDGKHKIIVATSVAEEGLDVRQCNWVVRYEHVTNSIARVQSRGKCYSHACECVKIQCLGVTAYQTLPMKG